MALVVNSNIASLNAQRNLNGSSNAMGVSLQRLSSGLRVNSAKDDAAALAISQGMTSQIRGSNQAIRNANDGISVGQTVEGAMGNLSSMMQRIRELAVQSSNDSVSSTNRSQLQKEADELTQEISRVIATTEFNGVKLLSGGNNLNFQVGYDGATTNQIAVSIDDFAASAAGGGFLNSFSSTLNATGTVNILTSANASASIEEMDSDIDKMNTQRAKFGAVQNRFEAVIANLASYAENLSASKSRMIDADYASETALMTRNQVLQQAGTAILAQANALPQSAMSLLR